MLQPRKISAKAGPCESAWIPLVTISKTFTTFTAERNSSWRLEVTERSLGLGLDAHAAGVG